jgi:DNA polymerase III delta prime subunit
MSRIHTILEGIASSDRVAGAYLFSGPPGAGKRVAADYFAQVIGCKKQDIFVVLPQGSGLKIDQVRELQKWVRYGPSASRYLLVIVEKADTLTDQAAAAFLKTLEEPPPGVLFVLLVEREDKVPLTILSRCQKLVFSELQTEWQPKAEYSLFYEEIRQIRKKGVLERLQLSGQLEKEREKIEELLYELANFARHELDAGCTRVILETVKYIKKRANLRLALDVMCLKLGG